MEISHESVGIYYHRLKKVLKKLRKKSRRLSIDESKLKLENNQIFVWTAVDVDTDECLAIWASEGRTSFHAYVFLKEVLKYRENKPEVVVDRCFFFRLKERTKGSETDFLSIALLLQFRAGWKALWLSIITGNVKLTVPQNPSKFFFSF